MSTHVQNPRSYRHDLLESMLNRTTLSTQRVCHNNILNVGSKLVKKTHVDVDGIIERSIKEGIEAAERRHTREIRFSLKRLRNELVEEKETSLRRQKEYFEGIAKMVAEQRDRAEDERIRQLKKKFEKEKEEALTAQFEELRAVKEAAVADALAQLRKHLSDQFVLEKEKAIAEALTHAREKFKIREQESINRTRKECQEIAQLEAARITTLHQEKIKMLNKRYTALEKKYQKELKHKEKVEADFRDLQTDYSRFMNYTDGNFHSDYMMQLRTHGQNIANRKVSVVTYQDIEQL